MAQRKIKRKTTRKIHKKRKRYFLLRREILLLFLALTLLGTGFYLKEKVDKEQILGIAFSFIGALFVIKPSFSLSMLPSLAGLTSVTFAGISYTVIRYLNDKENPNIIVFYFS